MKTQEIVNVAGKVISYDKSGGQGHCWVHADAIDCPPDIQKEIAAEIIDGKQDSCRNYVASNGQHYRWTAVQETQAEPCEYCRDGVWVGYDHPECAKAMGL